MACYSNVSEMFSSGSLSCSKEALLFVSTLLFTTDEDQGGRFTVKFATKPPLARHQNKLLLFLGGEPAGLWHQSTVTRYPRLVHKLVDVLWCRLYVTSTLPFMFKQHVGEGDEPGFVCVLPKAQYDMAICPGALNCICFCREDDRQRRFNGSSAHPIAGDEIQCPWA